MAQQKTKRSQASEKTVTSIKKTPSTAKKTIVEQSAARPKNQVTEPPSPLDQNFIDTWKEAGTAQAAQASDVEFVRRIYLDIIGRVPTVDEAKTALAMELSTRKGRRRLVESLLEHPDYPRNFALILRNALIGRNPMGGRDVDAPAFETWLRQQVLQNAPWDKMVREMLAGEGASNENGAVNYILAWARFGGSGLADENAATALTGKTTRVFLGLQIQCTQCHDHFLNSTWKQNDFWGINAFFLGLQREELPQNDLEGNNNNRQMHYVLKDQPTTAWSMFERRNATGASIPPLYIGGIEMPDFEKKPRRNALADYVVNKDRRQLARAIVNRYWAHFMGKGFVNPVDDFGDHNETILPDILDHIADQLVEQKFDLKWLIATICTSLPYQLSSELPKGDKKHDDSTFARMSLKPMSPEQLYESILTISSADSAMGTGRDADQRRIAQRQQWVRQFVRNFANDEGGENSEFEGTIPQAMMMMHGSMTDQVIASFKSPDSKMAMAVEKAITARQPIAALTDTLYSMILTRPPSAQEKREAEAGFSRLLAALTQAQQGQPANIQDSPGFKALRMAGEDITWALLNSNEFILNH
ncbi:MAG: DUF1549 domain-containing protein [bacterium]